MALLIFVYFIKIGTFTFGSGWSILAQMEQEFVDKRHWITKAELLDLLAVGKSLPGIMIPLIMEEMAGHGWMSADDLTNLIAIAEMTLGSLGVNCATFAGTQTAGAAGGLVAVLGVLSPAFTLTLAAAVFFHKFKDSKVMSYIMRVVKPLCIGMILEVLISLSGNTYLDAGSISWMGIAIGLLCFWLLQKRKMSVPKVIGIAAALGVVGFGVL